LVRATDAIRLCREGGYEELHRMRAWEHLEGLRRQDMGTVRDFVSWARLTGAPLSSFEDGVVLALLRGAIKNQDLVLLREGAVAANAPGRLTAEQRRLVKKIEGKTGRSLGYAGRWYRLVADADLAKLSDRDSYEVVQQRDAAVVLDAMAERPATNADLAALLGEARAKLATDWRPPRPPEGLILLRGIPSARTVATSSEPVYTPSQLKQLFQPTGIIEIELVDMKDRPVPGESWELLLPDGSKRSGTLDEKGYALISSVPDGGCTVTFPRLDAEAWEPLA
jgi:hypothetical protein